MLTETTTTTDRPRGIDWDDLVEDLHRKRCILFLGPSLPLYNDNQEKYDFYSRAAQDLSTDLIQHDSKYDQEQSGNIYYAAQKYLISKNKNRVRLEDRIVSIFEKELGRIGNTELNGLPPMYRDIASLPWHTIVNTQPDNLLKNAFRKGTRFGYYHYRNNKITVSDLADDHLVIYNLFGCFTRDEENTEYKVDSLVLTEEDQIDFVKNIVAEKPAVPDCIISRFKDERKRYIFLDFNLENWHFRLLLDALNLRKSPTISSQNTLVRFSPATREFYENKYGFLFVENNSETFISELVGRYNDAYPVNDRAVTLKHKHLYISAHDADDDIAKEIIKQLQPWVTNQCLTIWYEGTNPAGGDLIKNRENALANADNIVMLTSADSLDEPFYSEYVQPILERSKERNDMVIAVIARSWTYGATEISRFRHVLPADGEPIAPRPNMDDIYQRTAQAITNILWPR